MLDLIVSKHGFGASFWDLPSCFYRRHRELEEIFCVPYNQCHNGPYIGNHCPTLPARVFIPDHHIYPRVASNISSPGVDHVQLIRCMVEIAYTIRYPEFKIKDSKWVMRQTGIYHQYDTRTAQSIYALFSPEANSKVHQIAESSILHHMKEKGPFWLHSVLFSTHNGSWRHYIAAQENKALPIVRT